MRRIPCWSTPNGGARRPVDAANLKAEGALAGVPDLFCVPTHGLVVGLEVKAPPKLLGSGKVSGAKARVSQAQGEVMTLLTTHGVPCFVVRSLEDVQAALKSARAQVQERVR
jgi:hypothetical protein